MHIYIYIYAAYWIAYCISYWFAYCAIASFRHRDIHAQFDTQVFQRSLVTTILEHKTSEGLNQYLVKHIHIYAHRYIHCLLDCLLYCLLVCLLCHICIYIYISAMTVHDVCVRFQQTAYRQRHTLQDVYAKFCQILPIPPHAHMLLTRKASRVSVTSL